MMVSCCQKASLWQGCVLKMQTLLKKFLHPRFPVADSQEKAGIEWCSNRNHSGWCCQRGTENKEIPGLLHSYGLCTSFTHLCGVGIFESYLELFCSFLGPFSVSLLCNHPRDDPWLFQAPAELGRSHRAAVWPQLWEGICWLLLCPQQLRGLGII